MYIAACDFNDTRNSTRNTFFRIK